MSCHAPKVKTYSFMDMLVSTIEKKYAQKSTYQNTFDLLRSYELLLQDKNKEAMSILKKHKNNEAIEAMGIALLKEGRELEAIQKLKPLFYKTRNLEIGLLLASLLGNNKKDKEAYALYSELRRSSPQENSFIDDYLKLSLDLSSNHFLIDLEKAKADNVMSLEDYHYWKGKHKLVSGNLEGAEKEFTLSHQINIDYEKPLVALGVILRQKKQELKYEKLLLSFFDRNPESEVVLSELSQYYFDRDKQEQGRFFLEKLSDQRSYDQDLKVKIISLYLENKNWKKAIDIIDEIKGQGEVSPKLLFLEGYAFLSLKDYTNALKSYLEIKNDSSFYLEASKQIALIYSRQDKEKELISHILVQKNINKKYELELQIILARFYENRKISKQALNILKETPTNPHATDDDHYYLATIFEKNKLYEKSDELLNQLILKHPDNSQLLNFLGYSLVSRNKELPSAFNLLSKALSVSPEDGYILDSMGWYYFTIKNYQKALSYLKKAVVREKKDPVILTHLGQILQAMGKIKDAHSIYKKAFALAEKPEDKLLIEAQLESVQSRLPASIP